MYNYGYDKEKWCCINIDTGVLINLAVRIAAGALFADMRRLESMI